MEYIAQAVNKFFPISEQTSNPLTLGLPDWVQNISQCHLCFDFGKKAEISKYWKLSNFNANTLMIICILIYSYHT